VSTSVTNACQNYITLTAGTFHILVSWDDTTANPRITRLIRSEKSSRNTKTRKVNN